MRKRSHDSGEIYPDEIFLDASNIPNFDQGQFEGRLERPISARSLYLLLAFFVLIVVLIASQLFVLQVRRGQAFFERSLDNTLRIYPIFPERATIKDRDGSLLAWNDNGNRRYVSQGGFGHLLGYLGEDNYVLDNSMISKSTTTVGINGVEKLFNDKLAGQPGLKITEADAFGNVGSEAVRQEPTSGEPVILSIDARLQSEMFRIIKSVIEERNFRGGAGLIMDVETGELIAVTSYPEFSSEMFSNKTDNDAIRAVLNDEGKPFLDRAISGLYAPGSIIKPFMALAALAEGVIEPETKIFSSGQLELPNPYNPDKPSIFKDWKAHGWVDMREAISVSSDEYFYQIGGGYKNQKGVGIANIEKYVRLFGFGEITDIELTGEGEGNIPSPSWKAETFEGEEWRIGDTYHTVIGQYGFLVTPIQVVRAIGAIAVDGRLMRPTIVRSSQNGNAGERRVVLPQTDYQVIKEGMRMSVETGTAKGLDVSYVEIAAKTGTAELGASKSRVNSWVTGFFPYKEPRYAFAIVMESGPSGNVVGATYVMRQLVDWMHLHTPDYLLSDR